MHSRFHCLCGDNRKVKVRYICYMTYILCDSEVFTGWPRGIASIGSVRAKWFAGAGGIPTP